MSLGDLIAKSVRCTKCGTQGVGNCDCWVRCSCGWFVEPGKFCPNPETKRCMMKVHNGRYNRRTRAWEPKPEKKT